MLFYRAALDLSRPTLTFVADLVRGHRSRIGSRWRVLVHLRRNETFARLAAAFGIGAATAHRYVTEVIALLADLAPDLREAMRIRPAQGLRHPGRHPGADRPALGGG